MLREFWKIREVKELRNEEEVNQLLASETEDWRLTDSFMSEGGMRYFLARYEN